MPAGGVDCHEALVDGGHVEDHCGFERQAELRGYAKLVAGGHVEDHCGHSACRHAVDVGEVDRLPGAQPARGAASVKRG